MTAKCGVASLGLLCAMSVGKGGCTQLLLARGHRTGGGQSMAMTAACTAAASNPHIPAAHPALVLSYVTRPLGSTVTGCVPMGVARCRPTPG
jgi:hypothetical protein